jgi:hypothetical protein
MDTRFVGALSILVPAVAGQSYQDGFRCSRRRRASSKPSMPGKPMSRTITAGRKSRAGEEVGSADDS